MNKIIPIAVVKNDAATIMRNLIFFDFDLF